MGTLHHLAKPSLTPREIEIVAAYMAGEPLSAVCELYEISPAAIGMLMGARYGCGRTAEANSTAVTTAVKSRPRLVEQPAASVAPLAGGHVSAPASPGRSWAMASASVEEVALLQPTSLGHGRESMVMVTDRRACPDADGPVTLFFIEVPDADDAT